MLIWTLLTRRLAIEPTDKALRRSPASLQAPPAAETAEARPARPRRGGPRRLQPGSPCGRQSLSTDVAGTLKRFNHVDLSVSPLL